MFYVIYINYMPVIYYMLYISWTTGYPIKTSKIDNLLVVLQDLLKFNFIEKQLFLPQI